MYGPANMIGYASTKSFINTFSTSLRTLASANNVEVVTVEPGFIDSRMTRMMRGQGSSAPDSSFADAEEMAVRMKQGVEKGGVAVVTWPVGQSIQMNALKGKCPMFLLSRELGS
jgi:short-subunit dehydrogenase